MNRLCACVLIAMMGALVGGCKSERLRIKIVNIRPGFFRDDLESLEKAFDSIVTNKTTRADLEVLGIRFPGRNVTMLEGAAAYKSLGGENVFQGLGDKLAGMLPEINRYILVEFKYTLTTNVSSKIYWQTKYVTEAGPSYAFTLVLKRDGNSHDSFDQQVVVYKTKNGQYLDTHERDRSILAGPLEILNILGGAAGNVGRVPGLP